MGIFVEAHWRHLAKAGKRLAAALTRLQAPLAQRSKMLTNLKLCEHQHVATSSSLHEMTGNPNAGLASIVPKVIYLSYVLKTNEFTLFSIPNRSLYRYSKIPDTWNISSPNLFWGIPLNIHFLLSKKRKEKQTKKRKSLLIFIGNLDIYGKHFPASSHFLQSQ